MKLIVKTATALLLVTLSLLGSAAALAQEAMPHHGARPMSGPNVTPGWSMMSGHERNEHRHKMRGMKAHDECMAYQHQHHDRMASRARERGAKPPAQPRHDACMGMKH